MGFCFPAIGVSTIREDWVPHWVTHVARFSKPALVCVRHNYRTAYVTDDLRRRVDVLFLGALLNTVFPRNGRQVWHNRLNTGELGALGDSRMS